MPRPFAFSQRIRSFSHAGRGIWLTFRSQHNAWIHAVATLAVLCAGFLFGISRLEWCVVVLACGMVWSAEALNTAIECLADRVTKEFDPLIRQAKDVAAGAVLLAAIAALVAGILIFGPRLLGIF